jgi:hypothetical protein
MPQSVGGTSRRPQKRKHAFIDEEGIEDENMCHDDGCGRLVPVDELLCCKGPGCGGTVSNTFFYI